MSDSKEMINEALILAKDWLEIVKFSHTEKNLSKDKDLDEWNKIYYRTILRSYEDLQEMIDFDASLRTGQASKVSRIIMSNAHKCATESDSHTPGSSEDSRMQLMLQLAIYINTCRS